MPRSSKLIQLRNNNLKKRYHALTAKHPKWRNDAVIEELAGEFYLATRTVTAILNDEAPYKKIANDQLLLFAP